MAEVAGVLIDTVLQRVRDPLGAAHNRTDVVLMLLDRCQQIVNVFTKQVKETLTVTTTPTQQVYGMRALVPNAVKISDVRQGDRSLPKVAWETLFYTDRQWLRAIGPRLEVFAQLGIDICVLHPGSDVAQSLDVVYVKQTATLSDESIATEVSDSDLPTVLDLLEAVLSLRQREFQPFDDALKRVATRLVIDRLGDE